MRKAALLISLSLLFAPADAWAETKRTKAQITANKEKVKQNLAKRVSIKPEPVEEIKPQVLDFNLEEKLLVKTDANQIRQNIDLDSKYAPAGRKRGDVSVNPEFSMPDDPDLSKNGDYGREKEFKLKFGVGL